MGTPGGTPPPRSAPLPRGLVAAEGLVVCPLPHVAALEAPELTAPHSAPGADGLPEGGRQCVEPVPQPALSISCLGWLPGSLMGGTTLGRAPLPAGTEGPRVRRGSVTMTLLMPTPPDTVQPETLLPRSQPPGPASTPRPQRGRGAQSPQGPAKARGEHRAASQGSWCPVGEALTFLCPSPLTVPRPSRRLQCPTALPQQGQHPWARSEWQGLRG